MKAGNLGPPTEQPELMSTRRDFLATTMAAGFLQSVSAIRSNAETQTPISRIAFGSCAKQWEPQPIWNSISRRDPDVFLFLGDAIYGDWHGEEVFSPTRESLISDWERLAAIPEFAAFRDRIPILATWDNHDYGKHDGGAEFELKDVSKQIFLDFFGEPEASMRRKRAGIYDAKVFGPEGQRTQIILLDTRTFKSPYLIDERDKDVKAALNIRGQYLPSIDPDATLLGQEQWDWLEVELSKPAEIRFICSSTQVVADEKAMEEWGNYPLERQRLFNLIETTNANGVIFLSGNVHYSEISQTDDAPYVLTDFTSSGMTHSEPGYAELNNAKRIQGPFTGFNFGEVSISWNDPAGTIVTLTCYDAVGRQQFEQNVQASELHLE